MREGKIATRLDPMYRVYRTDIRGEPLNRIFNFLSEDTNIAYPLGTAIITNPPFSLTRNFFRKCIEYDIPFALLINADYKQWIIDAVMTDGCEKIIPYRRIDFITPNILNRIHEGEIWNVIEDKKGCETLKEYQEQYMNIWITDLWVHHDLHNYSHVNDVPNELLVKYSSSDFHSMWLTRGFNLGGSETFVDLPLDVKKENI